MKLMQMKVPVVIIAALFTAIACDNGAENKTMNASAQKAYEDGGCAYNCEWGVDNWACVNADEAGTMVEGTCGAGQVCCQVPEQEPKVQCAGECLPEWQKQNCGEGASLTDGNCSNTQMVCCEAVVVDSDDSEVPDSDTVDSEDSDTVEEPVLCPWACTYDIWNCEFGEFGELTYSGTPAPEFECSDEMAMQGKTLCCNPEVDTEIGADECAFDCTYNEWNCENGTLGGIPGVVVADKTCSPANIMQGKTVCCNTTGADTEEDSEVDTEEDSDADTEEDSDADTEEDSDADTEEDSDADTEEDSDADTEEDSDADTEEDSEVEVCPFECTYDEWNCENGSMTGLSADGFPVPGLVCSDADIAQGKTLCCNTVDVDTEVGENECPFDCTFDEWNCENGTLGGIPGIALPELTCSNQEIAQGKTLCCNTTGADSEEDSEEDSAADTDEDSAADTDEDSAADTDEDTDEDSATAVCPYECTYDVWNCENGSMTGLAANGTPVFDLTCSEEMAMQGKTLCCNTVDVDTEVQEGECPYDCTWDQWNCENGEINNTPGVGLPDLTCSASQISQGRTYCCNTTGM